MESITCFHVLDDLRHTIGSVNHPDLLDIKNNLIDEINRVETLITHVLNQDEFQQNALAKKLADFMYDIYAGVHLLEEAQYDIKTTGSKRRVLAAEQWAYLCFDRSKDRGILSNSRVNDEMFETLVCFADSKYKN